MLTLLKILLFGKWVVLTAAPITLPAEPIELRPEVKLKAVTSGAHVLIDVTSVMGEVPAGIFVGSEGVNREIPKGCLNVALLSDGGQDLELNEQGTSQGGGSIHLVFFSYEGVSIDQEYEGVRIQSCKEVPDIKVIWVNHSK